jgi:tetratricopeptide (TPR) repeat protein
MHPEPPRAALETLRSARPAGYPWNGLVSPSVRRAVWLGAAVFTALLLRLYAPAAWSAYHDWTLRRLDPSQLEAQVQSHPDDLAAMYRLGLAYSQADRQADATRVLLAVLQKDPVRPDVLNDLGVSYLLQERFYEASVALRAALEAQPGYAAAHANLGRLHLATKMPYTAVRELEQAARQQTRNVTTLCDLGEAYQATLNFRSAEGAYRRALAADSRSLSAHLGLGRTYISLARYPYAERELGAALALAPGDASALLAMGRLRVETAAGDSDLQAARRLLEQGSRSDPQEPGAWFELGRVQARLKNPKKAIPLFVRALQLSPHHVGAMNQLARALRAAGRPADADRVAATLREMSLRNREVERLEETLQHSPNQWDGRARLAELYIRTGKYGLAALVCRQIQDGDPKHPRLPALRQALEHGQTPRP